MIGHMSHDKNLIDSNQNITDNGTIKNDEQSVETPLNPTDNARDLMNDTSGMTGISADFNSQDSPPQDTGPVSRIMSSAKFDSSLGNTDDDERVTSVDSNFTHDPDINDLANPNPGEEGEASVSGDMPDPASDNDTLENSHDVGLRLDEDSEHPHELDIASDIDKAEEYQRTH